MATDANLRLMRHPTARAFLDASLPDLLLRESEYNLVIGLCMRLADEPTQDDGARFFRIEDAHGDPVGHAVRSSREWPLALTHMPDAAVALLRAEFDDLAGVVGPRETVEQFVRGTAARLHMAQFVYAATRIAVPPSEGGAFVPADASGLDLAGRWTAAFVDDCNLPNAGDAELWKQRAADLIAGEQLFFWEDGGGTPVSMAARTRQSPNGATIAYVYTPPELRRRGHAGRVVGRLSQRLLDGGKSFCSLYTDASNPTSNSIYRSLGYEVVGESAHYVF